MIDSLFSQNKHFNMNHQLNEFFCKSQKHHVVICESHHEKTCDFHRIIIKIIDVVHFLFLFQRQFIKIDKQVECARHENIFHQRHQFADV